MNPEGIGGQIYLNYFHTDEREIERHYTLLGAVHALLLKAFDRCLDGRFTADEDRRSSLAKFRMIAKELNDEYQRKYPDQARSSETP